MKIEIKYNIGDLVYYLSDNVLVYNPIIAIRIEIDNNNTDIIIKYCIQKSAAHCEWRTEDKCFLTKEELLKSL